MPRLRAYKGFFSALVFSRFLQGVHSVDRWTEWTGWTVVDSGGQSGHLKTFCL